MVIFYGAGAPNLQALLLYAILQPGGGVYGKGKDKKWKHLPKPDYKRASGNGEGYGKLLREI